MKSLSWKLNLLAVASCWMLFGNPTRVFAANESPAGSDERLQRLERRINELADRQDQMMRRRGGPQERPGFMPSPGPESLRNQAVFRGSEHPLAERVIHRVHDIMGLIFLGCVLCNILMAIWIFTDIRKRGEGSGIFIVLALVAGIPAAIIYSLVRIGDKASVAGK